MSELIWFSIPGSLVVATLLYVGRWPDIDKVGNALLTAGAVPLIGFIIHQGFRCLFEQWVGFQWRGRRVISEIQQHWQADNIDQRRAFLIWESTFYSDDFPESFREHDRGAWHYILSFWSGAFAAGLTVLVVSIWYSCVASLVLIVVGVVLGVKGYQTWDSLCDQELQMFRRYRHLFQESRDALIEPGYVPKESRDEKAPNNAAAGDVHHRGSL